MCLNNMWMKVFSIRIFIYQKKNIYYSRDTIIHLLEVENLDKAILTYWTSGLTKEYNILPKDSFTYPLKWNLKSIYDRDSEIILRLIHYEAAKSYLNSEIISSSKNKFYIKNAIFSFFKNQKLSIVCHSKVPFYCFIFC